VDAVVRYVYCGHLIVSAYNVVGLLVLSDKYDIADLKSSCVEYMQRHIGDEHNATPWVKKHAFKLFFITLTYTDWYFKSFIWACSAENLR